MEEIDWQQTLSRVCSIQLLPLERKKILKYPVSFRYNRVKIMASPCVPLFTWNQIVLPFPLRCLPTVGALPCFHCLRCFASLGCLSDFLINVELRRTIDFIIMMNFFVQGLLNNPCCVKFPKLVLN